MTHVPKMLTARYVQSSAVATKCVGSRSLFFRTVCVVLFYLVCDYFEWARNRDDMSSGDPVVLVFVFLSVE